MEEKKTRKVIKTEKVRSIIKTEKKHICNRCGGSMIGRPSWHWLCYSCWSMIHYGKSAGHGRWYGSESPKYSENTIWGYVDKKVEVEEEYSEFNEKIITIPPNIFKPNQIITKEFKTISLSVKEIVENTKQSLFQNEFIIKHSYWFGCNSFEQALSDLKNHQVNQKKIKLLKLPSYSIKEKRMKKEFNDMVGYFPNVPAFIQGNPLSMFNRKVITTYSTTIDLNYNFFIDSTESAENYTKKGQLFFDFVNAVIQKNIEVNIKLTGSAFTDKQTLLFKFQLDKNDLQNELKLLHYITTNVSFFRLFLLNYIHNLPELNYEWRDGLGDILDDENLKKLCNFNSRDVLFSNIEVIKKYCN